MNKIIAIIVVVIILVGGFWLFKNKSVAPTHLETNMPDSAQDLPSEDTSSDTTANSNEVDVGGEVNVSGGTNVKIIREFNIEAGSFYFSPKNITVNKGDTVKINVKNADGTHNLTIDEFNVATRKLNAGETQTITFVADKLGSFEYYCSVGNHRAMGMVGTLTVK